MADVVANLISSRSSYETSFRGTAARTRFVEVYLVSGIAEATPAQQWLQQAYSSAGPVPGSTLNLNGVLMVCVNKSARVVRPDSKECEVTVIYETFDSDRLSYGVDMAVEQTNLDVFDSPIVTVDGVGGAPSGHLVGVRVPYLTVQAVGNYTLSVQGSPVTFMRSVVGTVNNGPWPPGLDDPAETWLCSRVIGTDFEVGNLSYAVTWEFEYRAQTHRKAVVHIDPETGEPVNNPSIPLGSIAVVELYPQSDFNVLNVVIG